MTPKRTKWKLDVDRRLASIEAELKGERQARQAEGALDDVDHQRQDDRLDELEDRQQHLEQRIAWVERRVSKAGRPRARRKTAR